MTYLLAGDNGLKFSDFIVNSIKTEVVDDPL